MYHEGDVKDITVQKTISLQELILFCLQRFEITGKEVTECRLRAYDAIMKVRLGVFDSYEKSLLEMKDLYGRSTLDLEFKDESGNFEEYNSNWLHLRALKWEEGLDYDFSRPDSFPTVNIKVDPRQETVAQLEEKLSAALDIPLENCVVFLRHEHSYNSTTSTEYYNMDWRRPKLIHEVSKLDHGKVLYVEYGVRGAKLETYKWHNQFAEEAERITISINDVTNDSEGQQYAIKISLPRTSQVRKLKE